MKNRPYPLYPERKLTDLREMIQQKAETCPDQVAFRYMADRKSMVERTYSQFYQDVRALGTYMLKHRVTGRRIALISENSYFWLACYFAIVTTGNVAVLVAKDAAEMEAATLVFQSDADIILTSPACDHVAQYVKERYGRKKRYYSMTQVPHALESGRRALAKGKNYYDRFEIDPDELCSIFFTSGSTGFSKGVMLSQTNMISDMLGSLSIFNPCTPDGKGSTMSVLPYTHAFGLVISLMVPFLCGMPIFICSSLANFMREIPIAKPTILALVPLFVETFYKTIWRTAEKTGQAKTLRRGMRASDAMLKVGIDRRRELFQSVHAKFGGNLTTILCGGAPLDPRHVKEFRSLGIDIYNGYGITECSPVLAVNRNEHFCDGSVGRVLPNVTLRIAHPDKNGVGEIVAKGPNVMLGYYKDPQSTGEVLKDGWFHTGDLGYLNKDGFLFLTGRKKSLIILSNGENVSPEEIEQYVSRIDGVQEVVVYEDKNAITAEVYPEENNGLTREEIIRRIQKGIDKLNATLPNYKHIRKLKVRDEEFEKTSTRKIKRYKAAPKQEKPGESAPEQDDAEEMAKEQQ